jgi:hypothetical protein
VPAAAAPLADHIAEAERLIDTARQQGLTMRALGGVAICMQSPGNQPMLPRRLKDIDLVTPRGSGRDTARTIEGLGYVGDEMFNALRGARRQLYRDPINERDLDVFVGEFSMCHAIPLADRLDQAAYTVPLAELMLTKLQIVELNERDERDIYSICYHHELTENERTGIDGAFIARLCAGDWGLWRTCKGTIERCIADVGGYDLNAAAREQVTRCLGGLWDRIEQEPKTGKWRRRARLGERKRWYDEPEVL